MTINMLKKNWEMNENSEKINKEVENIKNHR